MRRLYAIPLVVLVGLVGCSDTTTNQTVIIPFPQTLIPGTTPSPGTNPGGACFAPAVRVGPFGYECASGVPVPSNTSGRLPLGCVAVLTATPKYPDGTNVPAALHGPDITWALVGGQTVVVMSDYPGEAFNKIVRPFSDTTADPADRSSGFFTITATVCGTTGSYTAQVF